VRELTARCGRDAVHSGTPPSANPPQAPQPVVKQPTCGCTLDEEWASSLQGRDLRENHRIHRPGWLRCPLQRRHPGPGTVKARRGPTAIEVPRLRVDLQWQDLRRLGGRPVDLENRGRGHARRGRHVTPGVHESGLRQLSPHLYRAHEPCEPRSPRRTVLG